MTGQKSVIMIGATGAVGTEAVKALDANEGVSKITLLGRRKFDGIESGKINHHTVNMSDPENYRSFIHGHETAICTLGVGEPSKVSKSEFLKVDHDIPLAFAQACKQAGVKHFQLLSSVGADPASYSFFLKSKGQLEEKLKALSFERLSLFHPSMILTPENRYGLSQAITLALWPKLKPVLLGKMEKLRGIPVERLGAAFAANLKPDNTESNAKLEVLEWREFMSLTETYSGN